MPMRLSYHVVFVCFAAVLMTAGCASKEVVRTDAGIAPATVARPAVPPKTDVTPSTQTAPATQATPAVPVQQSHKASSTAQLESALNTIYFDFDSANLTESARRTLTNNSTALMKEPSAKIRIEGNCDERGSAEYNLALGERRAKSAQQYLISLGITPNRLSTISYGKEKPAVRGSDESAWAKNRRDEFVVVTP